MLFFSNALKNIFCYAVSFADKYMIYFSLKLLLSVWKKYTGNQFCNVPFLSSRLSQFYYCFRSVEETYLVLDSNGQRLYQNNSRTMHLGFVASHAYILPTPPGLGLRQIKSLQIWLSVLDLNECNIAGRVICRAGERCVNTFGSYACVCPKGKTGPECTIGKCKYDSQPNQSVIHNCNVSTLRPVEPSCPRIACEANAGNVGRAECASIS